MSITRLPVARVDARPRVIALHCSGATGRQWRHLARALGPAFNLVAPDLIGCGETPPWSGSAFRVADEARRIVAIVDEFRGPVHLVGHSYGGGVALRVALERPYRVASLSLYEPTPVCLLRQMGPEGHRARAELLAGARDIIVAVEAGECRAGAHRFVDYWNGAGSFAALKPEAQLDLVNFMPTCVLNFHALFGVGLSLSAARRLRVPLRILCGALSPPPARRLARGLARAMNPGALRVLEGAGHMGPFSHALQVAQEIAAQIATAEPSIAVQRRDQAA